MPMIPDATTGRNTTHPIELEPDTRVRLRAYRRFLRAVRPRGKSSEDHVVNSALRYIFDNDPDFKVWLGKNPDAMLDRAGSSDDDGPKAARVASPAPHVPAAAATGARQ